jgi:hypothetical protein
MDTDEHEYDDRASFSFPSLLGHALFEALLRGRSRRETVDVSLAPSFAYNATMKRANGRVLERLLDPVSASLNDEAARKLLGIKADARTRAHVDKLARKCNEGELTPEERADYEMYVLAGDLIAILQAKARLLLSRRSQPA